MTTTLDATDINTQNAKTPLTPLLAAIAIQMTLGVAHVWSEFQSGIADTLFRGDNAKAGLAFSILILSLTIASIIGGRLSQRLSTRALAMIGGVIVSAGFLGASFVTEKNAYLIWLTYGIMGGFGMGLSYSTTLSCVQKWYPEKKGLATGLVVASLGVGSFFFAPIIESLINHFGGSGVGEPMTFRVLALVFLVVSLVGGFFLRSPRPCDLISSYGADPEKIPPRSYTPSEVLKSFEYYLLTATLLLASTSGLMLLGFVKPIAEAKGMTNIAALAIMVVALFNTVGRVFWSWLADRIARRRLTTAMLVITAIATASLALVDGYATLALFAVIGFCFGGFLGIFPSLTEEIFGPRHMATNYGMVLLGFGVGAVVSSQIAGYYKNLAENDIALMNPAFLLAAAFALFGVMLMLRLDLGVKKRRK